jgi:UMF1 family MFS transporter
VAAVKAVWETAKKIAKNKKILFFLLAYLFYIDGVGTVITMSTVYGEVLGLALEMMIVALLVTQLVAFPCSIIFSKLSQKFGSLKMIRIACVIYLIICITGFVMGFGLQEGLFGIDVASTLFWILATLVGTVQGGIQAISRSYFCQMIPPENTGEFFGFFDIFGRFASVMGPALYATIRTATGRPDFAILSIIGLFIVGLVMLGVGNKHFKLQ